MSEISWYALDAIGLLEEQLGELVEGAAPALPLVGRARGDIEVGVHAALGEVFGLDLRVGAVAEAGHAVLQFAAAEAHEYELEALGEFGIVLRVIHGDGAAAEDAQGGEHLRVRNGDGLGLHAAHGEAGHRTVLVVGDRAEVAVDVRDAILDQGVREAVGPAGRHAEAAARTLALSLRRTLALRGTLSLRALAHALRRTLALGTALAHGRTRHRPGTVLHHDDERDGLARRDEVVHDGCGMALLGPAVLVLTATVLQVQHRIALGGILVIFGRGIDEDVTHRLVHLGPVVDFPHLALRDVLHGVEVLVHGRDVDAAAPAAGAVVVEAGRVGDVGAVDVQLIVVESFILRSGFADPGAVGALDEVVLDAADVQFHGLGVGRFHAHADAALGIDHRILLAGLVVRRGDEVLFHLGVGGQAERGRQEKHEFFHRIGCLIVMSVCSVPVVPRRGGLLAEVQEMGLEFIPAVVGAGDRLDAGDEDLLLVVEDLREDLALLVLVEDHLAVGGHRDLEEGVPALRMGLFVGEDAVLGIVHAHQGEERQDGGVVAEAEVGGAVAAGLHGGVGLLDEVHHQRADGEADDVAVLDGTAPHAVDGVIAAGPQIDQFFRDEVLPEDVDAHEVDDLAQAAGGEAGLDEGLGVAEDLEGGVVIREQRGQEAGEVIAGGAGRGRVLGVFRVSAPHAGHLLRREGRARGRLLAGTLDTEARIDIAHEPFRTRVGEFLPGAFRLHRVGEVAHGHDAAEVRAGEAVHLPAVLVLEGGGEPFHHPGREGLVFPGAAGRQGAFHALVGLDDGVHVGEQSLAGVGKQVQGVQVGERADRRAGERGILLIPGAVASIMGDVERLEALRRLRVHDGIELVGVHVVRRPVGILGDQPQGVVLAVQAQAAGREQEGGEETFHCWYGLFQVLLFVLQI